MGSSFSKGFLAKSFLLPVLIAAAFILPVACGGGGGDGDSTAPTTPSLDSATAVSETRVDLSWTASTDDTGVTGYRIYDGTMTLLDTAGASATAYSDTGLTPDTQYCYRVSAIDDANNESELSTERCATTGSDSTSPAVPSLSSVSAVTGTQVSVTWAASTDNVGVDRYLIYRDSSGSPLTSVSGVLTFTDGGLTDATQFCYEVSAIDAAGNESAKSSQLCDTTPDITTPSTPSLTNVSAVSGTQVSVTWDASSDNVGVDRYLIYRGSAGSPLASVSGVLTFNDGGLAEATQYCYEVSAIDAAGNESARSSQLCDTTPDITAPSVPPLTNVSALAGTQVRVTWGASSDNVAVNRYLIFRDSGLSPISSVSGALTYTDRGLSEVTQYCYEVSAIDAAGNESAKSSQMCATTPDVTPPTVPDLLGATSLSATSISITWTSSTDNVAVAGYTVYQDGFPSFVNSGVTTRTYTSLTPGTEYCFEVSAKDTADNESVKSNQLCATTSFTVPFVTSTVPANGTTAVDPFDFMFEINFSEAMNTSAIAGTIVPSLGEPDFAWSNGDQTVTMSFPTEPQPATTYNFTLFGAGTLSANGVSMAADTTVSIRTRQLLVPVVSSSTPADTATNVDVNTVFTFNFNDHMNSASVDSNSSADPELPGGVSSWNADFTTWTITLDNRMSYDTTYEVTFGAGTESLAGVPMGTDNVVSFTTEEATAPYIVSSSPANGATNVPLDSLISGTFSEPMDTTWISGGLIPEIEPAGAVWSSNDTVSTLTLSERLAPYTEYRSLLFGNSRDAEGTAVGEDTVITFTTGGYDPFYVESTYPGYGDTLVLPLTVGKCAALSSTIDASVFDTSTVNNESVTVWPPITLTKVWITSAKQFCIQGSFVASTTYHIVFENNIYDLNGNPLIPYTNVFSTGSTIASGAISGQVSRDPDSVHDDTVEPIWVALLDGPVSTDSSSFVSFIQAAPDGSYHFSYLPDYSDYYVASLVDSARNGNIEPGDGDAFGIYLEASNFNEVAVSVNGGAHVSSVDFTLRDSEAITGKVYFGFSSPDINGSEEPLIYAFTGDSIWAGSLWLTTDDGTGNLSTDITQFNWDTEPYWEYELNPFFTDSLSVEGSPATGTTTTGIRTIIPGEYTLFASVLGQGYQDYFGFGQVTASIADTGDDALSVNIRLEEVIDVLNGTVMALNDFSTASSPYSGAAVSLTGWPLYVKTSNPAVAYSQAPTDLAVAVHTEPAPADAGTYVATNSAYVRFASADTTFPFDLMVLNKGLVDNMASIAGTTIASGKAQIAGNIGDGVGGNVVGAVITISSGDHVYYHDTTLTSLDELSTKDVSSGPQWVAFNVEIPSSGKAVVTVEYGGVIIADAVVPLRAGEVTIVDLDAGQFAQ